MSMTKRGRPVTPITALFASNQLKGGDKMNEDIFDQMKALGLVESTELEKEEPQEEKQK